MNLWFRAIRVIIHALFRSRIKPDQEGVVNFICWPQDIDPYLHMNNGRFLTIMDLGRTDMAIRSGIAKVFKQNNWWPVVGAATIRYKRSIPFMARYQLRTRLVGWDQRGLYMEQIFEHKGRLMARGLMKAAFPTKDGLLDPARIAEALGLDPASPPLPPHILAWEAWLRSSGENNGA